MSRPGVSAFCLALAALMAFNARGELLVEFWGILYACDAPGAGPGMALRSRGSQNPPTSSKFALVSCFCAGASKVSGVMREVKGSAVRLPSPLRPPPLPLLVPPR